MKLGTDIANKTIQYHVSQGLTLEQATIIVKSNSAKEKEYFEYIFSGDNIMFPNYQSRKRYMLNFDFLKDILTREGVIFFEGNLSPNGGQLGKFITTSEKLFKDLTENIKYKIFNSTSNTFSTDKIFDNYQDAKKFVSAIKKEIKKQKYFFDDHNRKVKSKDVFIDIIPSIYNPFKRKYYA